MLSFKSVKEDIAAQEKAAREAAVIEKNLEQSRQWAIVIRLKKIEAILKIAEKKAKDKAARKREKNLEQSREWELALSTWAEQKEARKVRTTKKYQESLRKAQEKAAREAVVIEKNLEQPREEGLELPTSAQLEKAEKTARERKKQQSRTSRKM